MKAVPIVVNFDMPSISFDENIIGIKAILESFLLHAFNKIQKRVSEKLGQCFRQSAHLHNEIENVNILSLLVVFQNDSNYLLSKLFDFYYDGFSPALLIVIS